jgi:hypothetical protein
VRFVVDGRDREGFRELAEVRIPGLTVSGSWLARRSIFWPEASAVREVPRRSTSSSRDLELCMYVCIALFSSPVDTSRACCTRLQR